MIRSELPHVDGIMIGRAAYANPYFLAEIQNEYFSGQKTTSRRDIIQQLIPYIIQQLQNRVKLTAISRHILGLYMGQRGASAWRRHISQHAYQAGAGAEVIEQALALITS